MSYPLEGRGGYPRYLDWMRYFCAFMLFSYGISKLLHLQFDMAAELTHRPVGSLTGYELTWFYYGYSRFYALILGVIQILGATLLLFRRTTLLGALTMLPLMINILLINMFVLVDDYGPYFISAVISFSLLMIIWHQRRSLFSLVWQHQTSEPIESSRNHRWIRIIIVGTVCAIMISGAIFQWYMKQR